mmetsp:Transcript_22685/g.36446  ORF Transcript_22685/g.36446 Transcript_22685/m.36446 type:complete len:107 (-) Transcript_22685:207-527(-)
MCFLFKEFIIGISSILSLGDRYKGVPSVDIPCSICQAYINSEGTSISSIYCLELSCLRIGLSPFEHERDVARFKCLEVHSIDTCYGITKAVRKRRLQLDIDCIIHS